MRAHGRGGLLLVVPADTDRWRESIVPPIGTPSRRPLPVADLMRQTDERDRRLAGRADAAVEAIAGLTAVDGATLDHRPVRVLAFGAKIARAGATGVRSVTGGNGGIADRTRRSSAARATSAAQFVHDQRDAVALVASQDGRFTVFAWSPCEDMVHAHRVEALLL